MITYICVGENIAGESKGWAIGKTVDSMFVFWGEEDLVCIQ